jgi:adenylate cyclase
MARKLTLRGSFAKLANSAWVILGAAVVGWAITQTTFWHHVELKIFDYLVVRSAPGKVELPITIIGIDETTFEALKTPWPLPRRHHARLIENLKAANVAVIAFDIAMPELTTPADDDSLVAAIQSFRRVVLAADHSFRDSGAVRQWFRVDPHELFRLAGALQGYSSMEVDGDAVLRRVPLVNDAFWRAVVSEFEKVHPGVAQITEASADMRIRYLGGPQTFTYVPYHQMLDPDRHLGPKWREFFQDNIVLVGRRVNVIQDVGAAQAEAYQTPFFFRTREFMPRVEAHANLIANMVAGETLREAPPLWALGALALSVLVGLAFMRGWHPVRSGILLAVMLLALGALEYGLFDRMRLWLPAAGAMMTLFLMYGSQGAVAFLAVQRQRREIRNAFSMYVSPAVVDQLSAQPERLKVGGERRELTIMFTDLAGFTTIAEGFAPEVVANIVNRQLTDMTRIIFAHGAPTVDKFLGDGIMAFWGAPLPDDRHSEHAVLAAIAMQARMHTLAEEIARDTGVRLSMRIGINRGECVVGNVGGDRKIEYTVMGDAVNLASRLEGVNKVYGTPILVSEAVVCAVSNPMRFREVDTVRVKGRNVGIAVFTPCADETLVKGHAAALAAYRAGHLDAAESAFRELVERYPGDSIAFSFLERIAVYRSAGLPSDWDGVHTLDEK